MMAFSSGRAVPTMSVREGGGGRRGGVVKMVNEDHRKQQRHGYEKSFVLCCRLFWLLLCFLLSRLLELHFQDKGLTD